MAAGAKRRLDRTFTGVNGVTKLNADVGSPEMPSATAMETDMCTLIFCSRQLLLTIYPVLSLVSKDSKCECTNPNSDQMRIMEL